MPNASNELSFSGSKVQFVRFKVRCCSILEPKEERVISTLGSPIFVASSILMVSQS